MVIGHILIYEWIYLLSGVFILGALAVSSVYMDRSVMV